MRITWLSLLLMLSVTCLAAPPITVTSGHPRVYLNAQRIAQIKAAVAEATPLNELGFPQRQGTVVFDIEPTLNPAVPLFDCSSGYFCKGVFDDYDSTRNHIFVRELVSPEGISYYQVVLQSENGGAYVASTNIQLSPNQWYTLKLSWNSDAHTAFLQVITSNNTSTFDLHWVSVNNVPLEWTPKAQHFVFSGRDIIDNIKVYNSDNAQASSLIANYPLNEGGGVDAFDSVNTVKAFVSASEVT